MSTRPKNGVNNFWVFKNPSHENSKCRKSLCQNVSVPKSPRAKKSPCQKVPVPHVPKSPRAETRRCRKVPLPKKPCAKMCMCWNIPDAEIALCRNVPVTKSSCAEKSPCRKGPMPKCSRVEMSICRNVCSAERRTCRNVPMMKYLRRNDSCRNVPCRKSLQALKTPHINQKKISIFDKVLSVMYGSQRYLHAPLENMVKSVPWSIWGLYGNYP